MEIAASLTKEQCFGSQIWRTDFVKNPGFCCFPGLGSNFGVGLSSLLPPLNAFIPFGGLLWRKPANAASRKREGGTTKKPKYIFLCYWTRKTNSKWSAFRTFTDAPSHWQPNNGLISAYWEQILQGHFTPHLWKQFSVPFSSTSSSFGLQKFYSDLLLPLSSHFCSCRYEDSGVEEGAAFRLLLVLLSVGSYEGSALGFLQTLLLPHARSLGCPLQQAWPFKQVNSYSLVASGVRRCEQKCLPCHCLVGKVLAS